MSGAGAAFEEVLSEPRAGIFETKQELILGKNIPGKPSKCKGPEVGLARLQ